MEFSEESGTRYSNAKREHENYCVKVSLLAWCSYSLGVLRGVSGSLELEYDTACLFGSALPSSHDIDQANTFKALHVLLPRLCWPHLKYIFRPGLMRDWWGRAKRIKTIRKQSCGETLEDYIYDSGPLDSERRFGDEMTITGYYSILSELFTEPKRCPRNEENNNLRLFGSCSVCTHAIKQSLSHSQPTQPG